jgi:hypothetical protein
MWRLAVPSVWATRELATDKVYLKRRGRSDHANLELTAKGGGLRDDWRVFGVRAGEPQRGDLTKPRLKAWVNETQTDARALKGRNNPFQSHTYRSS